MQLHSENNTLKTNVESTPHTFTIQASAKAFKILSSNLYTDKISAIIRELSCNALDSHIDAGNPDPFIIHLPTIFEPYFAVEDQGTGMTPQQIAELYTGYFSSNKTARNDQIGALGLGSKSPFAYTDIFTIDSVKDGNKYAYSAFLDKDGLPTYLEISTEKTDKKNGVRITFPVADKDFDEFITKAASILWAFDQKPIITGAASKYISACEKDPPILFQGKGWKMYKNLPRNNYKSLSRSLIRMGNILYIISDVSIVKQHHCLLENNLIIDMPLGSCDVAPSREELSYDQLTKTNILNRLEEVKQELITIFNSQIDNSSSVWEAAKVANKCFSFITSSRDLYTFSFSYKNKTYKYGENREFNIEAYSLEYEHNRWGSSSKLRARPDKKSITLSLGSTYLIVKVPLTVKFESTYLKSCIKRYCNDMTSDIIYVYCVRDISEATLKTLDNPLLVSYEDLPRVKQTPSKNTVGTPKQILRYTDLKQGIAFSDIVDKKKIYIIKEGTKFFITTNILLRVPYILYESDRSRYSSLEELIALVFPNILPESILSKVYIIPLKQFKSLEIEKRSDWVSLGSIIRTKLKGLINSTLDSYKRVTLMDQYRAYYENFIVYIKEFNAANFHKDSPMKKFIDMVNLSKTDNEQNLFKIFNSIFNLKSSFYDIINPILQATSVIDKDEYSLFIRYPLLTSCFVTSNYGKYFNTRTFRIDITRDSRRKLLEKEQTDVSALEDIINYIKMVDISNGLC